MKCQKKSSAVYSTAATNSKNLALLVFLATTGFAAPSISATWICGDNNWNNTGCWDWWDYPSDGEDVYLVDTVYAGSKTVNYVNGSYNPPLNNLYIESTSGFSTVLQQARDGITTDSTYVGIVSGGFGEYRQSAGSHVARSSLDIGRDAGSLGIYELSGTATLNATFTTVGYSGIADFIHTAGTHVTHALYVGRETGSDGHYGLSGAGSLSALSGTMIGYSGTGGFTQQGGTFNTREMVLGESPGSDGIYRLLTTGSLSTEASIRVGDLGLGRFRLNADSGTVDVGTNLYIGLRSSGNGSYTLRNGNLSVGDSTYVGNSGTGEFIQEGGRHEIGLNLTLGENSSGSGVYTLSGGKLLAEKTTIGKSGSGIFNQSGGDHYALKFDGAAITGGLTLGEDFASEGTYNLSAGNLDSYITFVGYNGTGVFNQTGGVHSARYLSINSSSYYHLDGGTLIVPSTIHDTSSSYVIHIPDIGSFYVVAGASGNLYIDGGSLIGDDIAVRNLGVGYTPGSNGSHAMSDGFMHATMEYIGGEGSGLFTQSGGLHDVGSLILGHTAGSNGTYELTGGNLSTAGTVIGNRGSAVFNQAGGTHDVANNLVMGYISGSDSSYTLSAGSLAANGMEIGHSGNSAFIQTGGVITVATKLGLGASGSYDLQGGALDVNVIDTAINGSGKFSFTGGTLSVDSYLGNLVNNGGTLAPGNSPGVTTIEGNYSQDINSTLKIELGGMLAGSEYDVLDISGSATLDGILDVSLFDRGSGLFEPAEGDYFDILMADTIIGEFDLLMLAVLGEGLEWELSYMLDDFNIDILRLNVNSAVPIPASVWLFGSGLLGLVCVARRKNY